MTLEDISIIAEPSNFTITWTTLEDIGRHFNNSGAFKLHNNIGGHQRILEDISIITEPSNFTITLEDIGGYWKTFQ